MSILTYLKTAVKGILALCLGKPVFIQESLTDFLVHLATLFLNSLGVQPLFLLKVRLKVEKLV